jgi:RNA methyltransferase, TrmH family
MTGGSMNDQQQAAPSVSDLLTRIRRLERRPLRDATNSCWIEGVRNFVQAFDAGISFECVVVSPVLLKSPLADMLVRRLRAKGTDRIRVTPEQFRSVSLAERASGIGAIVRQHWTSIEHAQTTRGLCWIVIEQIRNPGNLGTILRTCEATGVSGVIVVGPQCDPFDPVTVRGSMGGIFHLPLVRLAHDRFEAWVRTNGIELVGLSPSADRLWTDLPNSSKLGLVLGEERSGLSERLQALCRTTVRLPMTGRADSLNVGVAAGVMMYELVRRTAAD